MNWIDLVILAALASAVYTGFRRGALVQLFSWGGFVIGLVVGAIVTPSIVEAFDPKAESGKALVIAVVALFGTAFVIEAAVAALGIVVRRKITNTVFGRTDRIVGSVLGAFLLIAGVWLLGGFLSRGPSPSLAEAVKGSGILRGINAIVPPQPAILAQIGRFLDQTPFPEVFAQFNPSIAPGVEAPPPALANDPEILGAAEGAYKIESSGCGGVVDGSGFSVERGLVVTASHVVAGTRGTRVIEPDGDSFRATVVFMDTDRDIAVLRVTVPRVIAFETDIAPRNAIGAAIGYPGGGPRRISPARVRDDVDASGFDIYSRRRVRRPIYVLSARVRQGNSGGPFVDADGRVRGMIFAASTSDPDESYALTAEVITSALSRARGRTSAVGTGECAL